MREMKGYEVIDILGEELGEEYPRDKYVGDAKTDVLEFFNERKIETFYLKQIILFFEKKYYHWITHKAVSELVEEGQLKEYRIPFGNVRELRFIFHKRNRYFKRQSEQKALLVKEFSEPNITKAVGEQADVLFSLALSKKGFKIEGEDFNEFKGKKWRKTNHNLVKMGQGVENPHAFKHEMNRTPWKSTEMFQETSCRSSKQVPHNLQ